MSYLSGICGGQIIEAKPDKQKSQSLNSENYPHRMGVYDLPDIECLKKGITSCLKCPNTVFPPCVEIAYGKPTQRSK